MKPHVARLDSASEFTTPEGCSIVEVWNDLNDRAVSIARARVAPDVTTQLHSLDVDERYVIPSGRGEMELGELERCVVEPGDVVVIPAGTPQQIRNVGKGDLVFYSICPPRFRPDGYRVCHDS